MNRIGARSNSGEGGEDPERYATAWRRRLGQQLDQAGGVGALRRDAVVSAVRQRAADQDGAGIEARRRRADSGEQGRGSHRAAAARAAEHAADLAAAASRHLQHRGSRRARLRLALVASVGPHEREAGGHVRRGHHRRRRREGRRGCDPNQRSRRRHGRVAARIDQACRAAVGSGPDRCASRVAGARQPPPGHPADRRRPQDRPRCGDGGRARRAGIRLRHRGARRHRLRDGAAVSLEQLSRGHCHAETGAACEVRGHTGAGDRVLQDGGGGRAPDPRLARVTHARRAHRPGRSAAAAGFCGGDASRPRRDALAHPRCRATRRHVSIRTAGRRARIP